MEANGGGIGSDYFLNMFSNISMVWDFRSLRLGDFNYFISSWDVI